MEQLLARTRKGQANTYCLRACLVASRLARDDSILRTRMHVAIAYVTFFHGRWFPLQRRGSHFARTRYSDYLCCGNIGFECEITIRIYIPLGRPRFTICFSYICSSNFSGDTFHADHHGTFRFPKFHQLRLPHGPQRAGQPRELLRAHAELKMP